MRHRKSTRNLESSETSKFFPNDTTSNKVTPPKPCQTLPLTRDQVITHMSLWGSFSFKIGFCLHFNKSWAHESYLPLKDFTLFFHQSNRVGRTSLNARVSYPLQEQIDYFHIVLWEIASQKSYWILNNSGEKANSVSSKFMTFISKKRECIDNHTYTKRSNVSKKWPFPEIYTRFSVIGIILGYFKVCLVNVVISLVFQ